MQNKYNKKRACPAKLERSRGYTIIETMVAISLFLVVIMVGMGTLLNSTLVHTKSQDMRSIMDNLSFVMEDMSRNLRTGFNYHCIDDNNFTDTTPKDCVTGGGISFRSAFGNQLVYGVFSDGSIQKSASGGVSGSFVTLTLPEIKIDPNSSGFSVSGAPSVSSGDIRQPFVTIRLNGTITSKNDIITPFSLQTSVSQRLIDVEL